MLPFLDEAATRRARDGVRWYHLVIMLLLVLSLAQANYDRSRINKELTDNAKLIRMLQDKRVVDELAERRKGNK